VAPKAQVSGAQRFLFRSKYDSSYATFTPTLAYVVPSSGMRTGWSPTMYYIHTYTKIDTSILYVRAGRRGLAWWFRRTAQLQIRAQKEALLFKNIEP
jgi:hypothetical protein